MFCGKARTEQLCLSSWIAGWNDDQKNKFVDTLASQTFGWSEEDLLFGLDNMGLEGGPGVFSCQLNMFSNWWKGWNEDSRAAFIQSLANSDPTLANKLRERKLI